MDILNLEEEFNALAPPAKIQWLVDYGRVDADVAKATVAALVTCSPEEAERKKNHALRMKYDRIMASKKLNKKVPPKVVELISGGHCLLKLFQDNDGDWADVLMDHTREQSQISEATSSQRYMTRGQLCDFYKDSVIGNAIADKKDASGDWIKNPDLPDNDKARVYDSWAGAGRTKTRRNVDTKGLKIAVAPEDAATAKAH